MGRYLDKVRRIAQNISTTITGILGRHRWLPATLIAAAIISAAALAYYLTGSVTMPLSRDWQSFRSDLRTAHKSFETGQYKSALTPLLHCAATKPSDPNIRYALGIAYAHTGYPEKAIAEFETVTTIDPRFAPAFGSVAAVNLRIALDSIDRRDYPGALVFLKTAALNIDHALSLSPKDPDMAAIKYKIAETRELYY